MSSSRLRVFPDRAAAGVALAGELRARGLDGGVDAGVLVLGLPRGGVPIAHEIAQALSAPLDVMLVRKVGMPGQPELAIGAVASGNIVVREQRLQREFPHLDAVFERLAAIEQHELERRERAWRRGLPPLQLKGKTVILVDDGIATGSTMLAAARAARQAGAAAVIAAAPVAAPAAVELLTPEVDAVVVVQAPPQLAAIGEWYERFEQLDDAEVSRLLSLPQAPRQESPAGIPGK